LNKQLLSNFENLFYILTCFGGDFLIVNVGSRHISPNKADTKCRKTFTVKFTWTNSIAQRCQGLQRFQ